MMSVYLIRLDTFSAHIMQNVVRNLFYLPFMVLLLLSLDQWLKEVVIVRITIVSESRGHNT